MKKWVTVALFLAVIVVLLGAYTRLTDAGLGCPDWPGCYGQLTVPATADEVASAELAFPERPVEAHKAWNEMIHRYAAGTLGLLIAFITLLAYRSQRPNTPKKLSLALLVIVVFQAALGMWTVTMNLMPLVVMGHLLGGFTLLSCLFLLWLRLTPYRIPGGDMRVRHLAKYASMGLLIVLIQIALGGWTSANYAALTCTEFPMCEAGWMERLDFAGAFSVPEAHNYEFGVHDYDARMTMHIMHRIGAIITVVYLCWLSLALYQRAASGVVRSLALGLVGMVGLQVLLGISNVAFSLPLAVAVAHNGIGAALLLLMVMLNYTLYRKI